ncbi:MAG TPA: hypothetical protein VGG33_04320 [Polyangia bacterium]
MTHPTRGSFGVLTLAFVGCAQTAAVPAATTGFVLRTSEAGHISIGPQGAITGPEVQLTPTAGGYRGFAASANIDMRSEGERIVGSTQSRVIDLHYRIEGGNTLVVTGLFAGKLGRMAASHAEIRSALGVCSYQLAATRSHYEGERACVYSTYPVSQSHRLKLPTEFAKLPVDRQAMVLAVLLSM